MQQQAHISSCILLYFYLVVVLKRLPSASRLKLHLVPGAGKLLGDFHSKSSNHSQRTPEEQWPAWHPSAVTRRRDTAGSLLGRIQASSKSCSTSGQAEGMAQHLKHEPTMVRGVPAPSPTRSTRLLSWDPGNQDPANLYPKSGHQWF